MNSEHIPQHVSRNLAKRTVASVFSTVALVLGVGLSGSGVASGFIRDLTGPVPEIPFVDVIPAEPERVLVCAGPGLSQGSASIAPFTYGPSAEIIAGANLTFAPLDHTTALDGFSLEGANSPHLPIVVTQPAIEGPLAAVSYQNLSNLEVRGLAVSECQAPRPETWLVGGDSTLGRQTVLSLSNPWDVPATVNIEIWGEMGRITSTLGQGVMVQSRSQKVLPLAGLAPNVGSPVIRVTTNGVGIVAAMHTSIVRGLLADGLSVVTGQPAPSKERVITGVFLPPADVLGPIKGKEGYDDVAGALRLLSAERDTSVSVTILRSEGVSTITRLHLIEGQVMDLSLDELGGGDIAIFIDSAAPIVAAVRQSVGTEEATDTSWVGTSFSIVGEALVATPPVGESRITFANPGDTPVVVNFDGRDLEVPAQGIVTRAVADVHRIATALPIYAAVSTRDASAIGNALVLPNPPSSSSLRFF